mmetsp:Transcript_53902/g.122853  ORF Transcript_53902/g.122853 Transcript_53902/m.122853 type:complete len:415 (-) Transcript_53902:85-1329(-)|eukprot:CAMPEP_0172624720 /NCGR_PEP_ID=MMETSP1068-20121228/138821_1 /TAXON_ID=35684 /ORGANISM="Pseudopedinella elastica, Strain CCMP716" /LENGTH=414 /DNA_ID=CAMNT_0013433775 /DNA_START=99 /DNA_END=1343 /DNA_ORIENTATION=-
MQRFGLVLLWLSAAAAIETKVHSSDKEFLRRLKVAKRATGGKPRNQMHPRDASRGPSGHAAVACTRFVRRKSLLRGRCTFWEAEQCLRRRAILFLGTSVSRHWIFALKNLLGRHNGKANAEDNFVSYLSTPDAVRTITKGNYRDAEKELCQSDKNDWGNKSFFPGPWNPSRCQGYISSTETFLLFERAEAFSDSQIEVDFVGRSINGVHVSSNVVRDFLSASSIWGFQQNCSAVVINAGLELAVNLKNTAESLNSTVQRKIPTIIAALAPVIQAQGNLCWRLTTNVCCEQVGGDLPSGEAGRSGTNDCVFFHKTGRCLSKHSMDLEPVQDQISAGNLEIRRVLATLYPKIHVLDAEAMSAHSKCRYYYEDWVHAPVLAYEQIDAWMVKVLKCPCGGGPEDAKINNSTKAKMAQI